jgi:putative phosphoribosyl transferase
MRFFRGFIDRVDAGRQLGAALAEMKLADPIVLALPRGGVPVAYEVARLLKAPLDLVLVRKIGVPFQPELAAGAVVDGDEPEVVLNEDVVRLAGMTDAEIKQVADRELKEIERRRKIYLAGRSRLSPRGRTVIIVDDGLATGATMRAALHALKRKLPERLIVAVPVAPSDTIAKLRREADDVVCLAEPEPFGAIGLFYSDFRQLDDEDVVALLAEIHQARQGQL